MFESRKLEWMAPMAGGWGSGGGGGAGGMPDATGITAGWVVTADGDPTPAWAAPSVGGLTSPDGGQAVTKKRVFDVYDFNAAGSDRIEYCTWVTSGGVTTVTTKTAAGAARNHDYVANQYVALFNAGAACAVSTPPVTGTNATLTLGGAAVTFTVAVATDIITTNIAAPAQNGDEVQFSTTGTLTGDLATATSYFLRRVTNDRKQWQLYDTAAHAIAGGATGLIDLVEVQTITIAGSPTTGTWTASFNGSGPTGPIALGASAATVETALRTLTGLSAVTVTQSGSGNNLTYTVKMIGFSGDPPQMTTANTFDTGTVTPATVGSGTHTVVPYTLMTYSFSNGDGNGGFTPASATVSIRAWNNPPRVTTHYVDVKAPLSRGATSVIIYGRGASGRQALIHLDASICFNSSGQIGNARFGTIATNNGGLYSDLGSVDSGHGIVAGDWVIINTSSSGDTEYDVRVECMSSSVGNIIVNHPYTDTATGSVRPGHVMWRDYGPRPTLDAGKYVPSVGNTYLQWTQDRAYPVGAICYDPTNKLWYRCVRNKGLRMSGSSAPTWPTAATGIVVDNEVTWKIDPDMYPVDEPSVETRQTLLTQVATVPSGSTFTTANAASAADLVSVKLYCAHNDAIPVRNTVAAAKAYGRNCIVYFGCGYFPCYLPKQTNTSYWTTRAPVATYRHFFMDLTSGVTGLAYPTISIVADPGAWIAARYMQNAMIIEDLPEGSNPLAGASSFILPSTDGCLIQGGTWEWSQAAGGRSEVGAGSYTNGVAWIGGWPFLDTGGDASVNCTVRDVKVHWPNIGVPNSYTQTDRLKKGRHHWSNCELYYGGSDGDFTFNPFGDFQFIGGEIRNVWRFGSHGMYPGADVSKVQIANCRITDVSKFAIQLRAQGGNAYTSDIQLDHIIVQNSGAIWIGDVTSSNREYRIQITGCIGASLSLAETQGLSVVGGSWGNIEIKEDCERIQISNLSCDGLYAYPSDISRSIHVNAVDCQYSLDVRNCRNSTFSDISIRNACPRGSSLISGLYEWEAITGLTDVYRCKLRGVDYDPAFTAPTAHVTTMRIRDTTSWATLVSGTAALGAVSDDQWYFGNTELQSAAITGSPTGGTWTISFNGSGPTSGIALGASAATVQTAVRTLTGLSLATVTSSGAGNNLTYLIAFTGFAGDPPQITVAHTFTGGTSPTVTAATVHPYPGYDTYAVKIGDDLVRDPDANPIGTVSVANIANYDPYLYLDGYLENVTFRDLKFTHDWGMGSPGGVPLLTANRFGGPSLRTKKVLFADCILENDSTSSGLPLYLIDFNGTHYDMDITFKGGKISGLIGGTHHPLRIDFANGGNIWFDGVDLSYFGAAGAITNSIGNVHLKNCQIQTNRCYITPDAATEAWNINGTYSDATFDDGLTYHPVKLELGLGNAFPTTSPQVTGSTKYWWRTSNKKLYLTETDALNDANAITITSVASTNGVIFKVLDFSRSSVGGYGSLGNSGDAWGIVQDNTIRDAESLAYTDPGSDQSNYVIHRWLKVAKFDNAAARAYRGFDAPAAGTVEHEFIIENNGAFDCTFHHNASEEQTIAISGTPTGGNFIITHTGGSTAAISHTTGTPATAAVVQAALRLVPGLGLVTVTQSGSGTDLTYTVKMNGFNSDPAQFTSTNNLTGGTPVITHATPVAYTAEWINQLYTPGGTTLTMTPGTKSHWRYDVQVQKWRGCLLG